MAHGLTRARLRDRIAKETGYPPGVVAHVLDTLIDEMRAELLGQGEIYFRGLLRISVGLRETTFPGKKKRIQTMLNVKPVRPFRQRMNELSYPVPEEDDDG